MQTFAIVQVVVAVILANSYLLFITTSRGRREERGSKEYSYASTIASPAGATL